MDSLAEVTQGAFVRSSSTLRGAIAPAGDFPPASGRYILVVSYACPWASRCTAIRALKGLEAVIELSVVAPEWQLTKPGIDEHRGWTFDADTLGPFGAKTVRELYDHSAALGSPATKKFTVPLLLDRESRKIVNNESSDIFRMLNEQFDAWACSPALNLRPAALEREIDAISDRVYSDINDGVYKCGFAQSQAAYDDAVGMLFEALAWLEELLSTRRFLCGATLTEADIRLFVTLIRFDAVYFVHFKCNRRLIREQPNLHAFTADVYQTGGIGASTVNMDHIVRHYYRSHTKLNPYGIIPCGLPEAWGDVRHGRGERAYTYAS